MLSLVRELDRRDPLLSRVGWLHVALLAVMLAAMAFDSRRVLGIDVWIKPSKFAASIAIYVWTLAWFMPYLPGPNWARQLVRYGVSVAMIVEITCIAGQSLRGTASHFNNATSFDAAVFSIMGLMIVFNTLLEALVLALFLRPLPALAPAYLWGIRLGLAGSILGGVIGGVMIAHGAHTVGATDGGPGLWLVNWSTRAGDLRAGHAIGLHALQVLPLAGYLLSRTANAKTSVGALAGVALAYGAIGAWIFAQAMQGRPLLHDGAMAPAGIVVDER